MEGHLFSLILSICKLLKKFTDNLLCTTSHIDGGNRTDSIVLTLTNQIPVAKGNYDYGCDENGNHIYFSLAEDTLFKDLDQEFQDAILDYSSIEVWIYFDLTRAKRKAKRKGKQFSKQPKRIAKKVKRYRSF